MYHYLSYNNNIKYIYKYQSGISVGGEYTAIFAAIDELIPAYVRGRVDIILDGSWFYFSIIISFFIWNKYTYRAFGGLLASIIALIIYHLD